MPDADSLQSGLAKVDLYVKAPGQASYGKIASDTSGASSGSFPYTAAAGDGTYSFYTVATDKLGHVEAPPAAWGTADDGGSAVGPDAPDQAPEPPTRTPPPEPAYAPPHVTRRARAAAARPAPSRSRLTDLDEPDSPDSRRRLTH